VNVIIGRNDQCLAQTVKDERHRTSTPARNRRASRVNTPCVLAV